MLRIQVPTRDTTYVSSPKLDNVAGENGRPSLNHTKEIQ